MNPNDDKQSCKLNLLLVTDQLLIFAHRLMGGLLAIALLLLLYRYD